MPKADWNDPSVIKVGPRYVMYASSDQNFDFNIAIYRLRSDDGIKWEMSPKTPVFTANPSPFAWDSRAVETPSVVYFNNQYHLFYTAYPKSHEDVSSYKIGHAVSTDGVTWTRDKNYILAPTKPNADPNLDFNQYVVGEPGAVVFNGKIYLYFTAIGANQSVGTTLQVIGLTTSADGKTWSKPQMALAPDQKTYPRAQWMGYSTPSPVVQGGRVHLYFSVYKDSPRQQQVIHHASSVNGMTNWVQDTYPVYRNTSFSWTSREIRSPAPFYDNNKMHLWFAGDNGSLLGIGYASCTQ